ncbi:hypothetical protein TNCV_26651 [Trichonephila clavipes]|uniref:DUF5641 domain-containing protein n=1 Tax=Trichonephila clavipes TaxID=2585209 RepID=A0A8X7BN62_TRICX|nr:hypothetical protein TNCV_26651 [Trichonephila clavipes]
MELHNWGSSHPELASNIIGDYEFENPIETKTVATIQQLTNAEQWHLVSSEQNPADLVSRGLDPSSLHNNSLWWNGPTFSAMKDFPESKDGVLRIGGRHCKSDLNFECKFPIILPCKHKLKNLIVEYFHLKYFHLGPQALLYQRSKWKFKKENARVGDLVLIKEDNLTVNKWLMGRLIEVFPGKDNRIRVVTIKTQHGVVKRPISKICILPMRE